MTPYARVDAPKSATTVAVSTNNRRRLERAGDGTCWWYRWSRTIVTAFSSRQRLDAERQPRHGRLGINFGLPRQSILFVDKVPIRKPI
jgi:hypothetical protein